MRRGVDWDGPQKGTVPAGMGNRGSVLKRKEVRSDQKGKDSQENVVSGSQEERAWSTAVSNVFPAGKAWRLW